MALHYPLEHSAAHHEALAQTRRSAASHGYVVKLFGGASPLAKHTQLNSGLHVAAGDCCVTTPGNETWPVSRHAKSKPGLTVAAGPGDGKASPVRGAHPMEITTDGAGTVFGGQARQDRLVVEIMDPGRKTIGSTSLAEMGVDENAKIQEV